MYYVDANAVMNGVVLTILGIGVVLVVVTIVLAGRRRSRTTMSYLYMLSALFVCFGLVVAVLGFRGRKSGDRPWHFFLDMKYQAKYTAQGQSKFFADGREARLPPENTVPFDGTDYFADAGYHSGPNPNFLKADPAYYLGVANPTAKAADGQPVDPKWANGKPTAGYFVLNIPDRAVAETGGWEPLLNRGRQQFNVHCAACHGTSGRGGQGDAAYGIVGAYGLSVAPANLTGPPFVSQPDGQLFNTITNGKGAMPGYGHQVKPPDRWAIVAHVRVLQYAHNPAGK
ncbi:MAG TPA: cytochrome c [Gemmataceae bacterium]|nr:cytochrome c [Gemmataceae bacterium]